MIDGPLAEAYRRTAYVVWPPGRGADEPFVLRHGALHPEWDRFLAREAAGCREWAMVTAYNPRSKRPPDDADNVRAHAGLERELRALTDTVWPGEGRGDDGAWTPEPKWMAVGISLSEALRLGRAFGQNAILHGLVGGPARIVLCDSGSVLP